MPQFHSLLLWVALTGCSAASLPPQGAPSSGKEVRQVDADAVSQTVKSFLSAWLVDRDLPRALSFFGEAARGNEQMLQSDCAPYVNSEDRESKSARRRGIESFLRDFLPEPPAAQLKDALNPANLQDWADQLAEKAANDPGADWFGLARLTPADIPPDQGAQLEYLKQRLPPRFYVAYVPLGDGLVDFIWVEEGSGWKIYHASVQCM